MKALLRSLVGMAAIGSVLAVAEPSKASCFSTLTDNNCEIFDPLSPLPNTATVSVQGSSLTGTTRIQIGFSAYPTGTYTVNNIAWSRDGVTFNSMSPSLLVSSPIDGVADARYTNFLNVGAAFTAGQTLYFRYDLPTTAFPSNTQLATYVRTNNNGAINGSDPFGTPLLSLAGAAPIRGTLYTFNHQFVPGPVPILGAAAAFSASRRLRRRLKAAA